MDINEILITYGNNIEAMAVRLAEEAGLASLIGDKNKKIGLKPNLVVSRPAAGGATTHVEIAAGLIGYLKKNGFNNITILEGSWVGGSTGEAYKVCGYAALASETGVKLVDTKRDKSKSCDCKGLRLDICESALAIDFMINLPVLKGHCQAKLTCALKNNKGVIPDSEKRRYHSLGLTKPIAHLNTVVRNDFIVVDGICGDLDFEEGGNPLYGGRLFAARDPVLCDAYAASLMGYSTEDIPYIGLAGKLGVGNADLNSAKIRELNSPSGNVSNASSVSSGKVAKLISFINESGACSACYASLVYALSHANRGSLERMKEKICIGQGFKGKHGNIGIGQCCSGFKSFCAGCPPSGVDVLRFLGK
uniref:Iron-sulfur cluster-binding protein n=1 Tax=uncultured bacterium contig00024 TaxID=1181513 RepID=A0A806KH06_9BACT|nr:iron-sulfur cluster-binding protein [uncultured bacterium contig00024]